MGLPVHHLEHEDTDARQARLQVIAAAVTDAAEQATCSSSYRSAACSNLWPGPALDLGVLLITQAYEESRLAKNVHEGKCRPYECDPIRIGRSGEIKHRARSLWQIHRIGQVEEEWEHMVGTDFTSTRAAAWAAAKVLSRGYRACGSFSGAISQYAGVGTCHWSEAKRRGKLVVQLRARARQFEKDQSLEFERSASNE
jgi:hypothetical protein